jgi:hypothetical protein
MAVSLLVFLHWIKVFVVLFFTLCTDTPFEVFSFSFEQWYGQRYQVGLNSFL